MSAKILQFRTKPKKQDQHTSQECNAYFKDVLAKNEFRKKIQEIARQKENNSVKAKLKLKT